MEFWKRLFRTFCVFSPPGTTILGVLRALKNFATTKINSAELLACEVTFLHMSVNCKEEKLTVSRKKVIFMGSILEQKILQLLFVPIFTVGLANFNFFLLLSGHKCVCHYFDAQFLELASQIWLKQQDGKRRTYHPNNRSKLLKNACTA